MTGHQRAVLWIGLLLVLLNLVFSVRWGTFKNTIFGGGKKSGGGGGGGGGSGDGNPLLPSMPKLPNLPDLPPFLVPLSAQAGDGGIV